MTRSIYIMADRCVVLGAVLLFCACRPDDVLSVPPPATVVGASALAGQSGAESAFKGATAQLFDGIAGTGELLQWAGLLTDEFTWSSFTYYASYANIDARQTAGNNALFVESGDGALQSVLAARSALLLAESGLQQYESGAGLANIGEAYALAGYAELFLDEDYCAGAPLANLLPSGGFQYLVPVGTDSLFGMAEAHFDSALAYANGNDTIEALASVGLGRARLDRGDYANAAAAVSGVVPGFQFNMNTPPSDNGIGTMNLYSAQLPVNDACGNLNVSDHEGSNGLDFVSAHDPRLVLDSTLQQTCDGQEGGVTPGTWYYPTKFGNPSINIALATGVEARLIVAEADLAAHSSSWLADLNVLRTDGTYTVPAPGDTVYQAGSGGVTGLAPLADPLTDSGRVSLVFRERAFWLFGTGTRLGDLRRLVRQYHRDQATVFPSGPYANGHNANLPVPLPDYGTDVALTLPTQESGKVVSNPYYAGCLVSLSTA